MAEKHNRRGAFSEEEELLLKALHDAMNAGNEGGILEPGLSNLRQRSDALDSLDNNTITEAARNLHQNKIVLAEEALRPRTVNPKIALTPKGWQILQDMGMGPPEEWVDSVQNILELLYKKEQEDWDTPTSWTWLQLSDIIEQLDVDFVVTEYLIRHLVRNGMVIADSSVFDEQLVYHISEHGAQVYENENYEGEIKGFD